MSVTMIGLDIAKSVFQLHGIDASGSVHFRRKLRRGELVPFFEGHRQVAGSGLTMLAGRGRRWRGVQAAAAIPLISAHVSNARALAARYSLAGTWSRRRWKRLLI